MKARQTRNAGFTLVELLIVVAIIGVLATLGVPQYKRMVERAKSKEAQVSLAGVYTTETAFFAEYGTYGNNLVGLGFDLEGAQVYTIGFTNGACGSHSSGEVRPTVAPYAGATGTVQTANPSYYTAAGTTTHSMVFGRGVTRPAGVWTPPTGLGCLDVGSNGMPQSGGWFVAAATGCIASGCVGDSATGTVAIDTSAGNEGVATASPSTAQAKQDAWVINQRRNFTRVTNGGS